MARERKERFGFFENFALADNRREKGGVTIVSSSVCQANLVLFVTICFAINKRNFFD